MSGILRWSQVDIKWGRTDVATKNAVYEYGASSCTLSTDCPQMTRTWQKSKTLAISSAHMPICLSVEAPCAVCLRNLLPIVSQQVCLVYFYARYNAAVVAFSRAARI